MSLTKKDKEDIKNIVTEALGQFYDLALKPIERKIDDFVEKTENNFIDVHRQINDLKIDIPTRREFNSHERRITGLEQTAQA